MQKCIRQRTQINTSKKVTDKNDKYMMIIYKWTEKQKYQTKNGDKILTTPS